MCPSIVENAWKLAIGPLGGNVKDAVKMVAKDLTDWSRNVLGDLEKRIKRVRKDLEECRRKPICSRSVDREDILK